MESVLFQNVHELRTFLTDLVNKQISDNGKEALLDDVEVIFQFLSRNRFPLEVKENTIDITIGTKEKSRLVKDVDEDFLAEVKEILKEKKVTAFVNFKCKTIRKPKAKNTAFGDALSNALGDIKAPKKENKPKANKEKKSTVNLKENILHIGSLLMVNTKEALDAVVISQFRKVNAKFRDIKLFKEISYSFEPKVFPIICQSTDSMDIELRVSKNEYSLFVNKFSFATLEQLSNLVTQLNNAMAKLTEETVEDVAEDNTEDTILVEEVDTDIPDENEDTNEDIVIGEVVEEVNSPE